ncbi:MAG: transcription-repair coupling factor [Alphaproteobacteria bacterium]|nr:transcription-repair coupling factor [Alphaproteobacteria bacterium]
MINQIYSGVPDGYEAFVLVKQLQKGHVLYVASDEKKAMRTYETLLRIFPKIPVLFYPAWDTVPYDRTSPSSDIVGNQLDTLIQLQRLKKNTVVITSVPAVSQLIPPTDVFSKSIKKLAVGDKVDFDELKSFLVRLGYQSTDVVMQAGDFAVRGEIVDIFTPGLSLPVRLDFFDDELESIRFFNPTTQRTTDILKEFEIKPVRLFELTEDNCHLFRSRYRELFDNPVQDMIYQAVSQMRYMDGMEHYLPLFYSQMVSLFDYLPNATVFVGTTFEESLKAREAQVNDYYQARSQFQSPNAPAYHPLPPDLFFISSDSMNQYLKKQNVIRLTPFQSEKSKNQGATPSRDFVDIRVQKDKDLFLEIADYVRSCPKRVVMTTLTEGAGDRLVALFKEKELALNFSDDFNQALKKAPSVMVAPFETGFQTEDLLVLTETDMFGQRLQSLPKRRKAQDFIADISSLSKGDLVVHTLHGIGRFVGLETIQVAGAAHDCLLLEYAENARLFVPVENTDVLSRYGSGEVALDRLGNPSFANRKAKLQKDLMQMADKLMKIAGKRALHQMPKILAPHGLYQEFCARFPYTETEDQLRTVSEIESDLSMGKPMDRLVCGDVGFGKTEVAMRAAFLAVMAGYQVAVIAPTTLLARQHTQNFIQRFDGFPIRIASLSRLVSARQSKQVKDELQKGSLDIVVGTHALLSKTLSFKNLGLVIVDEEQHFGVKHKERLKEMQTGVHVLTLTATPIPRTLQLSLSGVRDLSVIATPPVDRLAVKTYVMSFDPVVMKEAILRENFRGGQTFVVVPRISDMDDVYDDLKILLPDLKMVKAHGQMPPTQLEKIMSDFTQGDYDVLIATSIIESGLDLPRVNTMIVYRADMFGLAGLYQLRGRVGRGKQKAYAYLTTTGKLSENARKRLEVMQKLDSLGAGFMLASHDLDIRGAGNLLGSEQSGHIREIGVALYQKMLAEAVQSLKHDKTKSVDMDFSPQISVGLPVLIPADYINELDVRMDLYHRMGEIRTLEEVNTMRSELKDRFGMYPVETENLFLTLELKLLARQAHIERLDAGEKGATISFFNNTFPNPAGLVDYIKSQVGTMKIRPDQKVVAIRSWKNTDTRLKGIRDMIQKIAELAVH